MRMKKSDENLNTQSHFDIRTGYVHVNNTEQDSEVVSDDIFYTTISKPVGKKINIFGQLGKTARTHYQTLVHEAIHWWQYTGTNFGSTIFFMHHQNLGATAGSFINLEGNLKESLIKKRLAGEPIIETSNASRDLIKNNLGDFWEAACTAQANRLVVGIINNNAFSKCKDLVNPILFQDTFTQCMYWVRQEKAKLKGSLEIDWDQTPYQFSKISLIKGPFGEIGLPELLEGQARALQIIFLINRASLEQSKDKERRIRKTISDLIQAPVDSVYSSAYQLFKSFIDEEITSIRDIRRSYTQFVILCDIALSSPTPFSILDKSNSQFDWDDIYPPTRFFQLLLNINKHPFDEAFNASENKGSQEIIDFWRECICNSAGIINCDEYLSPNLKNSEYANEITLKWDASYLFAQDETIKPSLHEFCIDTHSIHQHLRATNNNIFVDLCLKPEEMVSQLAAAKISKRAVGSEYRIDGHDIIFPPAIWDHADDGKNQISGLGRYLTTDTILSCMIENFFFNSKKILDVPFPNYILQEDGFKEASLKKFSEVMKIPYSRLEAIAF